jgi:Fe-S-cluster containining protein
VDQARDFECLRCATCCRNLLETSGGELSGLPLFENEKSLFLPDLVSPKIALGFSEPDMVILFQLNVNCCPHLTCPGQCEVYASRPLMCRSFPVVAGAISNRCRVYAYRKVGLSYVEPFAMKDQLLANAKFESYLRNRIKRFYRKGLKLWEYDLASKKWIFKKQYDSFPY